MYDGVLFRSPKFKAEQENAKEYQFAVVAGHLVKDPEIKQKTKLQTSFTIKYYTKSFLNVTIWGNSEVARVAATLEQGDYVLCIGTITYSPYTVRSGADKGKEKIWSDLNPQILIPMSYMYQLVDIFASRKIKALLASEESDSMESIEDHADEYEVDGYQEGVEYEEDYEVTI